MITKNPTQTRLAIYLALAFLSPIHAIIVGAAENDQWPSLIGFVAAVVSGVQAAIVAWRAYIDKSVARADTGPEGQK